MRKPVSDLTNDKTVLKIMETLQIQHKTENDLIDYLGLANGTFTKWKYRNGKSYRKHIDKIAEFLQVTPDYLTQATDHIINLHSLTPRELRMVQLYRKMGEGEKNSLISIAEYYVMATEYQESTV